MHTLLLFDIDGTLTHGRSDNRFVHAIEKRYGVAVERHLDFGGFTDKLILEALLENAGWDKQAAKAAVPQLLTDLDPSHAETFDKGALSVSLGATSMLTLLQSKPDVILGLLTGNTASVAERKLSAVGLWQYFSFGCYGDDPHEVRSDLIEHAFTKTGLDTVNTKAFIIGDTARDIIAAHEAHIYGIGIINGSDRRFELEEAGADAILEDFQDHKLVLKALQLEAS